MLASFCRHLWDEDLETWDMIEKIDDHTDVFFYTTKSMILQPKRRHVVLRWLQSFVSFVEYTQVSVSEFNWNLFFKFIINQLFLQFWPVEAMHQSVFFTLIFLPHIQFKLIYFPRSWTDLDRGGVCALVSTSINHAGAPPSSGVPAIVLASRYLVESLENGKSRLTHISRVDQR